MDPKQTSGEERANEEAAEAHEDAQAEHAAAHADAGGVASRTQAPRVSADAFLALLARLDGKSGKDDSDSPSAAGEHAADADQMNPDAGHAGPAADSNAPVAAPPSTSSIGSSSATCPADVSDGVPTADSVSNAYPLSESAQPPQGQTGTAAGQAVGSKTVQDAQISMPQAPMPDQPPVTVDAVPNRPADALGGGVSELDVAFASAMVQETESPAATPSGDPATAPVTTPDMGGASTVIPDQPPPGHNAAPGAFAEAAAMEAGMAMPGMSGMSQQPPAMPDPAAFPQTPVMPGAVPPSPTPPAAEGMAPFMHHDHSPAERSDPQAMAAAPAQAAQANVRTSVEDAEAQSADVLAERLLAIMAMPDSHAQPSERALATDGLILKLPDLSPEARRLVAERFCLMERPSEALTSAVLSLVSGKMRQEVLENARFSTWRLLKLVEELDETERRVIARRRHLPTVVSDALIKTGDAACLLELVRNAHARIDEHGFHALVDLAAQQPDLQAPLATRSDLPPAVGFRLFRHVPPRLRRHLVSRFLSDSQLLDRVFSLILQDPPPATAEQVSRIESMIDSVAAGETETAARLLARLLDLHEEAAGWIVADRWGEPLVAVLKVLGYARTTFPQAMGRIIHSPASPIENGRELTELQALFDSLSFNKARLLLLYWDWEARRKGPYALLVGAGSVSAFDSDATDADADQQRQEQHETAPAGESLDDASDRMQENAAAGDTALATIADKENTGTGTGKAAEATDDETNGMQTTTDSTAPVHENDLPGGQAGMSGVDNDTPKAAGDAMQRPAEPARNDLAAAEMAATMAEVPETDMAAPKPDAQPQNDFVAPPCAETGPQVSGVHGSAAGMQPYMPDMAAPCDPMPAPCQPAQAPCPPAAAPCMPAQAPCAPATAPCMPAQASCAPGMAAAREEEAAPAEPMSAEGTAVHSQMPVQPQTTLAMAEEQPAFMQHDAAFVQAGPHPVGGPQPPATMPAAMTAQMADASQTAFSHEPMNAMSPGSGGTQQTAQPMAQPDATMAGVPNGMSAAGHPVQAASAPQMDAGHGPAPSPIATQAPAGMSGAAVGMPDATMMNATGQPQPAGMAPAAAGASPMPPLGAVPPEGGPVTFGKRKVT